MSAVGVESLERRPAWLYFLECAVITLALVLIVLGTRHVAIGETVNSRLATVWSLCNHGTWRIDQPLNPFEARTIDKVMVEGRLISSKPPVLPLAMTAEYWLLERATGWQLEDPEDLRPILQFMILTLIVLPFLLGLVAFALLLDWFLPSPWHRLFLLVALALGTQASAFAPQLNNHVPAVGFLLLALYFALGLATGNLKPHAGRFLLLGLFGGLVCTLDIPAGIFVLMAVLLVLRRYPKQTLGYCALGAIAPLAFHFGVMIAVTGSPLPVQMNRDVFLFEASRWRNPMGIDALNEPKLTYLFHLTFGRYGTFLLFPVLIAGLGGGCWGCLSKGGCVPSSRSRRGRGLRFVEHLLHAAHQ